MKKLLALILPLVFCLASCEVVYAQSTPLRPIVLKLYAVDTVQTPVIRVDSIVSQAGTGTYQYSLSPVQHQQNVRLKGTTNLSPQLQFMSSNGHVAYFTYDDNLNRLYLNTGKAFEADTLWGDGSNITGIPGEGSGTTNHVPMFTSATTIGNSLIKSLSANLYLSENYPRLIQGDSTATNSSFNIVYMPPGNPYAYGPLGVPSGLIMARNGESYHSNFSDGLGTAPINIGTANAFASNGGTGMVIVPNDSATQDGYIEIASAALLIAHLDATLANFNQARLESDNAAFNTDGSGNLTATSTATTTSTASSSMTTPHLNMGTASSTTGVIQFFNSADANYVTLRRPTNNNGTLALYLPYESGTDTIATLNGGQSFSSVKNITTTGSVQVGTYEVIPAYQNLSGASGRYDNYSLGTNTLLKDSSVATSDTLSGITCTGQVDGRIIAVTNTGTASMYITNQDAGSTAGNRFLLPSGSNLTIVINDTKKFRYDGVISRWRVW